MSKSSSFVDLCETPDHSEDERDGQTETTDPEPEKPPPPSSTEKKTTDVEIWSMNLDAFILNTSIFTDKYYVAPLNRPDHSAFLPGVFSKPDAVPMVDIEGAYPWQKNSRIADITKEDCLRENRLGVYLHWTLPKEFRNSDVSKTDGVDHGHIPDRWIVFRCITDSNLKPPRAPNAPATEPNLTSAPALSAFIVESNRIRHFGGHFDPTVNLDFDVEIEASPFIDKNISVEKQVDVFLGMKSKFDDQWDDPAPNGIYHKPLTLLDSANPLFADFQPHNSGVFSIHDDVSWVEGGKVVNPEWANISYAVFGYYSEHSEGKSMCYGSLFDVKWKRNDKPGVIEAENIADNFLNQQPVALGTDTLEALETYLHSLPGLQDWVGLIDEMKLAIGQAGKGGLLDNHIAHNLRAGFKPSEGGRQWRYNNDAVKSLPGHDDLVGHEHIPSPEEMKVMLELDRRQAYTDALERQEKYLRHRLFCEWWKRRSRVPGGKWSDPKVHADSHRRIREDLKALEDIKLKRKEYNQNTVITEKQSENMHPTSRPEFFSRTDPSLILGGVGQAWPSEFLTTEKYKSRKLAALPLEGANAQPFVQKWLNGLVGNNNIDPETNKQLCMDHGMRLFFENPALIKKFANSGHANNAGLMRLPAIFQAMDSLGPLKFNSPGWVRVTIDTLMQEWGYVLSGGDPKSLPDPKPAYFDKPDIYWNNKQPFKVLFIEWELEYWHLPKRFWRLERNADGTADYKICPDINISSFDMMEAHKRTISGRSLLRPNAEWVMTTLVKQMFDKLDASTVNDKLNLNNAKGKDGIQIALTKALKDLSLLSGTLDGLTDNLLTLHGGLHISPYDDDPKEDEEEKKKKDGQSGKDGAATTKMPAVADKKSETKKKDKPSIEKEILAALKDSEDGHDVTPYGEDVFSLDKAEMDFKPVTHGQARFTKFNIVDKFGQVISPMIRPAIAGNPQELYPCLGRSIACQKNLSEGGNFANSVNLDGENVSQFFQLGHRINQDARLNTYFAVNSADYESYHESTQFFKGDRDLGVGRVQHSWRRASEFEDPVWGWLMLDFRTMGIQVYSAAGESMGEALVPDSIHGKAYWQVYYAEGDLSEEVNENSQLQELIRRMSDTKFLVGLWAMLSEACQNIYHDPMSGDTQMLNMVGRPLALVNIGMSVELATPVMETQSYQDLLKREEIKLDEYKFEVLLGDKANLHDGLIGYFPPTPTSGEGYSDPLIAAKQPDAKCIYTDFGYPGRNIVDDEDRQKPDAFASPALSKVYLSPLHVNPGSCKNPIEYDQALCNHPSTVILGAVVDPYMPIHIATGILPSTTLKLPQWIIDQTLKKLRILLRGGPVLTRGDLPGAGTSDVWQQWQHQQVPLNQTKAEAAVPALTDKGEWAWLQPVVTDYAERGEDEEVLPKFVPYNLKQIPSDYPLEMGPHTVLEGFYKCGLLEMKDEARLEMGGKKEAGAEESKEGGTG